MQKDKKEIVETSFEESKQKHTGIFDINSLVDETPYEEQSIEELQYILDFESSEISRKDVERIKKIIKEKIKNKN